MECDGKTQNSHNRQADCQSSRRVPGVGTVPRCKDSTLSTGRKVIDVIRGSTEAVVRETFRRIAAVRGAAAVHPHGVAFKAELELVAPLPEGRYDAVARLSKGAGTPGDQVDVLGLAIRVQPAAEAGSWDLLLSSAGQGRLTRCLPVPAGDWSTARYSTLAPYEFHHRWIWLMATPRGPKVGHSSVIKLDHNAPEGFTLAIASQTGGWLTVGRLTLLTPLTDTGDRFDPMLNSPPGWRLAPAWLRTIREMAYQGSRRGHNGTPAARPPADSSPQATAPGASDG
ncbi:hypothetical protein EV643_108296 [Kribbella sp. VKM Ac-2527]|uniref:Phosphodiesterase n=1 Tax=Kribbella caucasensis TaxID=2512215 RepID=A0A4R6KCP7_9ACTN|nr:hypothetical protein EV643_108296 [Kribbella sp. VKM Ac-2527]